MPLANVFTPLPLCHPHKANRTNIIHCPALSCKRLVDKSERTDKQNGKDFRGIFNRAASCRQRKSPEHREVSDRGCELQEKLAEKLNDEEKEILTQLVDTLFDESCYDAELKFQRGFRLGVLMIAEIFAEQDMFL